MSESVDKELVSGARIARNTLFNLAGFTLPFIVLIITIPLLIDGLGDDRFGILLLAWAIVGYFSLFDIGISRATTKYVSEYLGKGKARELPKLIWTAIVSLFVLGLAAMLVWFLVSPWLISDVMKIPNDLIFETKNSFLYLGFSIPVLLMTAGIAGVFKGQQRFGLTNAIGIPASLLNYLLPLFIVIYSQRIDYIVGVLVIIRFVVLFIYFTLVLRSIEGLSRPRFPVVSELKRLLIFGGWMTVSRVINPIMVYLDKFFVASLVNLAAVTHYGTPMEMVSRVSTISHSFMGALFPALSAISGDPVRLKRISLKAVKYSMFVLLPIAALVIVWADPILSILFRGRLPAESVIVLQILALGLFINSLAQVPFSALHAMDRPDITAKIHLFELPFYVIFLMYLLSTIGIVGAAIAWTARIALDTLLLFWFAFKYWPQDRILSFFKNILLAIFSGGTLLSMYLITFVSSPLLRFALPPLVLIVFFILFWIVVLDSDDRKQLIDAVTGFFSRNSGNK